MAISAPYSLSATMASSSRINLAWTNADVWSSVKIERKASGGSFAQIASVSGATTSYADTSCQDGTLYYYRVRAYEGSPLFEYSAYSSEANATTKLDAPSGLSGSATTTTVVLTWNDNCQNESGFYIYKNGAYLATVGMNIRTYTATGLSQGTWYTFTVKAYNAATTSAASNSELIWTADPPAKPSNLVATATGTTTGTLNWTDNADNEVDHHVERSATSATAGFAEIGTVSANVTTYADTGRTSNTQYWYRVRAHNASGYSAYSNVATMVTWAAIAQPTNLTAEAFSGTQVDIRFIDNSELEDDHRLERRLGAGAYSEIKTLEPNRTFYRDSGLTPGADYTYRVRAKQGSSYSAYSNEADVKMLAALAAPADLAVSEYQDTWARLTWTKVAGATGYRIAQSTPDEAAYAIIASVDGDVDYFKATGLTAGIKYYWKVLSYSGYGNGSYCASVNQTTRAAYLPSKFEKLIRKSKPNLRFYVEANPLMQLSGWTLTAAQTYTYELPFDERGAEIDTVHENGVALTLASEEVGPTTIATVEATAGTWWHDTASGKVYIHTLDGTSPAGFTITCSFWLYFTTWKTADCPAVFNGNEYLPLVAANGIPDISQEVQQYYGDNFIITSGQVSLINGKINKQFHFDKLFAKYIWLNRKMKILAGGPGFTYDELVVINTGIINPMSVSDQRANFDLRDYRDGLHKALPTEKFSIDEFPRLNENAAGQVRQVWFGTVTNVVPVCVDTTNRVFEFHNGRCKSVTELRLNGSALVENTDYFVDYGLGQFTLARGIVFATSDILLIDFVGMTNTADEAISNGADIFKYGMNEWLNVPTSDLGLDSIYKTKYDCTQALALGLWKETGSQELIRRIEQSIMAYSIQDAEGRLGLRSMQTTAVSGIKYISSLHVFDLAIEKNQESLFSAVNFYYGENPSEDRFSLLTKTVNTIPWLYGTSKALDIYVAIASVADTETLAALVLTDLNKQKISFSVPRNLYTNFPGDLIYFNRDRFPSLSGVASNLLVRILSISKQYSSGKTQITAEVV